MKLYAYILLLFSCNSSFGVTQNTSSLTAEELLGNPDYPAICYGGYRESSRSIEPTLAQIKDDLKLLQALNFKFIRMYNVHFKETENVLKVIRSMRKEDPSFEMYLMLGAWIDCKNAWTTLPPIHNEESARNELEIKEAVRLANAYPEIVKVISVGNEAMVKWATTYYVEPHIILKWVNYLQDLKIRNKLPKNLWITSSDNFASWGGGDSIYHTSDLVKLYNAVDFISIHTYPMHDTHYNPDFWKSESDELEMNKELQVYDKMTKAVEYAKKQYESVRNYMKSLGINKPIHIGETGWATQCNGLYGNTGSGATDELKASHYYNLMKKWTDSEAISMFYFEAFDETWKDAQNPHGSENHFGLFTTDGKAKFVVWQKVDDGVFEGLNRNGCKIRKTYDGQVDLLWKDVHYIHPVSE
jgi:exo-beta-1,3-glucanase (GH17 family)